MDLDRTTTLRLAAAPGLTPWLEQEVSELGYAIDEIHKTGLDITGSMRDAMRLNLYLRTAQQVLYLLDDFPCENPDDLYRHTSFIAWEELLDPDGYLSIVSRVDSPTISNSTYPSLKVKDAIVDRIAESAGRRPDAGPDRNRFVVNCFWIKDHCWLYLNTSGQKLADRGYRKMPHKAPMRETLAAGVLMAAGYDGSMPFINPMCGSGTLAIEAALIATGRPPGLLRTNFGFMHEKGFDPNAWQEIRNEARKVRRKGESAPIIATDIDERAVQAARQNAKTAGVDQLIEFATCDFADTPLPTEPGIILLNPEYGMRLGQAQALESLYKRMGDFFKQKCSGHTGYIFTGNLDLAKKVGLRASRRIPFFNAKIDCRLLKYELYAGTRRKPQDEGEDGPAPTTP